MQGEFYTGRGWPNKSKNTGNSQEITSKIKINAQKSLRADFEKKAVGTVYKNLIKNKHLTALKYQLKKAKNKLFNL